MTTGRLVRGAKVRVVDRVRVYGGRVGTIASFRLNEVGVRFGGTDSVWFRPQELVRLATPPG